MNTAVMKGAVRAGLVAGIAVWFLALVGIIERLADLSIIGGSLTMDQILIFLPAALAGWVAVRPRVISGGLADATGQIRDRLRARGRTRRRAAGRGGPPAREHDRASNR